MFWIFLIVYIVTVMVLYGFYKEEHNGLESEIQELKKQLEDCKSENNHKIAYQSNQDNKPNERIIYKDRIVEKKVEVPVEKIVYIEKKSSNDVCLEDIKKEAAAIIDGSKKEAEYIRQDAKKDADRIRREADFYYKLKEDERKEELAFIQRQEEQLDQDRKDLEKERDEMVDYTKRILEKAYKEKAIILGDVDVEEYLVSMGTNDILKANSLSFGDAIEFDNEIQSVKNELKENKTKQRNFKKEHQGVSCSVANGVGYINYLCNGILHLGTILLDLLCDNILRNVSKDGINLSIKNLKHAVALCEDNLFVSGRYYNGYASYETDYVKLKIEELKLVYNINVLREKKKEEQRILKEQQREEAAAQREFERELKRAQKDQQKAEEALRKAREEAEKEKENTDKFNKLQEQIASLQTALEEANQRSERVMSMAQQTRQGWVYIISNIGSFGENVYKIGMTRRLDPMERVNELGDASVPFPFDVHAMIFSEDAPALETALHQAFEASKTNLINGKKEFFNVSLSEIKEKVRSLGYDVDFAEQASAPQYRDTLFARKSI